MRTRIHDHGQVTDEVRRVVEHEVQILDHRLADIEDDLKLLDVNIEHHLRDDTHTAKLVLWVPSTEIVATGNGPRREAAIRDAFADLSDELDVYLAKLRGEPSMRREGKFHRDKADLAREIIDAEQDWPSEPPHSDDEAASWAMPQSPAGQRPSGY
jgi:hypothetical protein